MENVHRRACNFAHAGKIMLLAVVLLLPGFQNSFIHFPTIHYISGQTSHPVSVASWLQSGKQSPYSAFAKMNISESSEAACCNEKACCRNRPCSGKSESEEPQTDLRFHKVASILPPLTTDCRTDAGSNSIFRKTSPTVSPPQYSAILKHLSTIILLT